jgi:hypothetical protein
MSQKKKEAENDAACALVCISTTSRKQKEAGNSRVSMVENASPKIEEVASPVEVQMDKASHKS